MISLGIIDSQKSGHLWSPTSAYEPLASVTVPSGGLSSIDFGSIPQTYKHLQIRAIMRGDTAATDVQVDYRFNANSNSVYTYHHLQGNGANAYSTGYSAGTTGVVQRATAASASASIFGAMIMDIIDYSSTSKYKTIKTLGGEDRNGAGNIFLVSNTFLSTDAVTSISIYPDTGNWAENSSFALYGIKG